MLLVLAKGNKHRHLRQSTSGTKNSCAEAATQTGGLARFLLVHPLPENLGACFASCNNLPMVCSDQGAKIEAC